MLAMIVTAVSCELGEYLEAGNVEVDQVIAHHVIGEFGVVGQTHFFEQAGAVDADRFNR